MLTALSGLILALIGAILTESTAQAQQFAQKTHARTRLLSPAGLGSDYSGVAGAGIGLASGHAKLGVKVGDFVLQPRFFVEGAYSTNFFREDARSAVSGQVTPLSDVFMLQLRPGVGIYNPGFSKVAISAGIDANIRLPLTGSNRATDKVDAGGVASLNVAIWPKGPFTLVLYEQFRRDLWTRPASAVSNVNRNQNKLGADMAIKPGGGAIEVKLSYRWDVQRYDDADTLDRDGHNMRFLASWRFYPLNFFFLESTLDMTDYPNTPSEASSAVGNYLPGMPFKAFAGLSGYFTPKLGLLLRLGYGNSFLESVAGGEAENFNSFIGMMQLTFRFTGNTVLHIGASRDYHLVPFGGYRTYVRGYTSFEQRLGKVGMLHLDAAYDVRSYGAWKPYPVEIAGGATITPTVSAPNREDSRFRAGALIDFDIHRSFGVTLGYRFDMVMTDFSVSQTAPAFSSETFTGYTEHRVYTTLNLRY